MITDYAVLKADDYGGLTALVKQWIAEGWQPQGGVTSGTSSILKCEQLYQAMVWIDESGEEDEEEATNS